MSNLLIEARFPAGRYHATPWGTHVNEGAIEWPPSPWRLLRAMLAAGFGRLGWSGVPDEARWLIGRLGAVLPRVWLPGATAAHTRHYMPPFSGNTSKVIDTFAYVGGRSLVIDYEISLTAAETELLDRLLGVIPYLGRAESWVAMQRVVSMPDDVIACEARESSPGPGYERIALLAPELPDEYRRWRQEMLEREIAAQLADEVRKANAKGKKPPLSLPKRALDRIEALFPNDIVDSLLIDTTTLRKQGWSQPPGSRWIGYWRQEGTLRSVAPTIARTRGRRVDTALLTLASDSRHGGVLPPMRDAVLRLELLHDALVRASTGVIGHAPSPCFTGSVRGDRIGGHRHASLIPLTLSTSKWRGAATARVDHVLVYCPMGFDDSAHEALRTVSRTYAKGMPTIFVTLAGLGTRPDFDRLIPHVRRARVWTSATPFVPPLHLKRHGRSSLAGQVARDADLRGLPEIAKTEIELDDGEYAPAEGYWSLAHRFNDTRLDRGSTEKEGDGLTGGVERPTTRFRHFRRARPTRPPPTGVALGLRLTFVEPVDGPVLLGYGSHFGLGSFVPVE